MDEVQKLLKKIIKKIGDKEAKYFFGWEYSSDGGMGYKAMIKFSREGVPPFLAGGTTEEDIIKDIRDYLDGTDVKQIAIRYCEAQIHQEEQAIKFHRDLIADYEKMGNENTHP